MVALDIDGTLVDTERLLGGVVSEYVVSNGGHLGEPGAIRLLEGVVAREQFRRIGQLIELDPLVVEREVLARFFDSFADGLRSAPGSAEAIEELKSKGLEVCTVTNGEPAHAKRKLSATGLLHLLPLRFHASEVRAPKPDPAVFLHAAREMGVAPNEMVALEDNPSGVHSSTRAGVLTLGFVGFDPSKTNPLREAGATSVVGHFSELPGAVEMLRVPTLGKRRRYVETGAPSVGKYTPVISELGATKGSPPAKLAIGVDVGAVSTKMGVVDERGNLLRFHVEPSPRSDLVPFLTTRLRRLSDGLPPGIPVGIGIPGMLDIDNEGVTFAHNHPYIGPIKTETSQQIGAPVWLYGDVPCAAAAEAAVRSDVRNITYMYVGTGVRAAFVQSGEVLPFPGEIGTLRAGIVDPEIKRNILFEGALGGNALLVAGRQIVVDRSDGVLGRMVAGDPDGVTAAHVIESALADPPDRDVLEIVRQQARELGVGIFKVQALMGSDLVVIGGGLTSLGTMFTDRAIEVADTEAKRYNRDPVPVQVSTLTNAGVIGAAALAMQDHLRLGIDPPTDDKTL